MTKSAGSSGPERTCIACRNRYPVRDGRLVRIVLMGGVVQPLASGRNRPGGRGAWLCRTEACVGKAVKTRAFARAFRAAVTVPPLSELVARVVPETPQT